MSIVSCIAPIIYLLLSATCGGKCPSQPPYFYDLIIINSYISVRYKVQIVFHYRVLLNLDCMQAFFEGKLKVSGNTALALKLQSVMPKPGQAKL